MPKFLRTDWWRMPGLGHLRKKKQKWRRAGGRHNKIREKRRGYPCQPEIGYGTFGNEKGKIQGKNPVIVWNVNDLEKVKKEDIVIIAKIGNKKKIEIAKVAEHKKIIISNLNVKKFLKNFEKKGVKNESKK